MRLLIGMNDAATTDCSGDGAASVLRGRECSLKGAKRKWFRDDRSAVSEVSMRFNGDKSGGRR